MLLQSVLKNHALKLVPGTWGGAFYYNMGRLLLQYSFVPLSIHCECDVCDVSSTIPIMMKNVVFVNVAFVNVASVVNLYVHMFHAIWDFLSRLCAEASQSGAGVRCARNLELNHVSYGHHITTLRLVSVLEYAALS